MVNSLTGQMTEASNATEAKVQQVRQDLAYLLKSETVPFQSEGEQIRVNATEFHLLQMIKQLRVVDVALPVREYSERTQDADRLFKILTAVEDRVDAQSPAADQAAGTALGQKIVDHLALASIYDVINKKKAMDPLKTAYLLLGWNGDKQNARAIEPNELPHTASADGVVISAKHIVAAHEEIQKYYPQPHHKLTDFSLPILQMQDLDNLLVANARTYIEAPKKDESLALRFANLLDRVEDREVADDLINTLIDQHVSTQQSSLDLR